MPHSTQGGYFNQGGYLSSPHSDPAHVETVNPPSHSNTPHHQIPIHGHGNLTGQTPFTPSTIEITDARMAHYYPPPRADQHYHSPAHAISPGYHPLGVPALAHRASVPNMRLHQGMALGQGPPPFPGPSASSYWQVPTQAAQHSLGTPLGVPQPVPSPTFPPTPTGPIDINGGSRQDPSLVASYAYDDTMMARGYSHSSIESSPSDGSFYTPISNPGGNDYFGHERELRCVSNIVGGHHQRGEIGSNFASAALPGTISLAHIQENRQSVKCEPPSSVTESEGGSPPPSIHSSPAPNLKAEYQSPQVHPSSSAHSNGRHPSQTSPERLDPSYPTPGSSSSPTSKPQAAQGRSADDSDEYVTEDDAKDDDFRPRIAKRPVKQRKGMKGSSQKRRSSGFGPKVAARGSGAKKIESANPSPNLTRAALLSRYPNFLTRFPLAYHALRHDLLTDDSAAPKIGSIPNTVNPQQKCDLLRDFYGRGRRVIDQLDAFCSLVKFRNSTIEPVWPPLSKPYAQRLITVRRKVVERTENYTYTRRDILKKISGRCCPTNNAKCIADGMIRWDPKSGNNDPAGDLAHRGISLATSGNLPNPACPPDVTPAPVYLPDQPNRPAPRPMPSRSSLRASVRTAPSPIMVPSAPGHHHPSSVSPASAGVSGYVPIALPPTPISAVAPEPAALPIPFSALVVSTPAGQLGPDQRPRQVDLPMSTSGGKRPEGRNGLLPAAPLPSPSALGLALGPNRPHRRHTRTYSTDTELTSSSSEHW